jgi:ABC-type transport system substrate-binding protein
LIEKLCYGEYEPLDSYFQGGEYQNPDNEVIRFSPDKAAALLAEAGWKDRGPDGFLMKDGKPLRLTLTWHSELTEKFLTSYKEACKQVGVDIQLDRTTPETMWKNLMERKFQLASIAWGGLIFPNPETSFHGSLANVNDNNNITGVSIPRVDELCKEYDTAYTQEDRRRIIREIDGLVFKDYPYVLQWYQPCQRVAYWNKFGMPEWGIHRFSEWEDAFSSWWVDPEKVEALKEARKSGSTLEHPEVENKYWLKKAESVKTAAN